MKKTLNLIALILALLLLTPTVQAQTATYNTTLSAAVADTTSLIISVASTTNMLASTQTQEYDIWFDGELAKIQAVNTTSKQVTLAQRGIAPTRAVPHNNSAVVYFGPAGGGTIGPFAQQDPIAGTACNSAAFAFLPLISLQTTTGAATGRLWNCIAVANVPTNFTGIWMRDDGYLVLGPGACASAPSGNSTGTNGPTEVGTVLVGVTQVQTSNSGTNTHNYSCNLSAAASRLNLRGIMVRDVVFSYGVQTTGLGTQVATLSSGTINSVIVFSKVVFPAPGASETASSNAARADAGSLLITPAVSSFNVATTTAGQFYSAKFTPATPFQLTADLTQFFFNVALLNTATSATITNSPGAILHYAYLPD